MPVATLVPHVDPRFEPGWPPYSVGARLPRTAARTRRLADARPARRPRARARAPRARRDAPAARAAAGRAAVRRHLAAARARRDVPAARVPAARPARRNARDRAAAVGAGVRRGRAAGRRRAARARRAVDRAGRRAPAAARGDRGARRAGGRARARRRGTAASPTRRCPPARRNTRLVEWVSYARTMPRCDVVVCHGGHGTVVRALASGCAVVVAPAAGDQNENAARVDWAGAGVRIPRRLVSSSSVALAVRRALADGGMRERARAMAAWLEDNDPGLRARRTDRAHGRYIATQLRLQSPT